MRLLRVRLQPRKVVIYHATWGDVKNGLFCLVGRHVYELVREYPRVGAKEEMCLHCMKARYTLASVSRLVEKTA
jgi:hypothetical protein